jgi:hypothetical protein
MKGTADLRNGSKDRHSQQALKRGVMFNTISFATFLSIVPFVTKTKKPVLIRGRHGIGKSEVVYQYAANINLPVIERRASQMTEGDLLGLPTIKDGRTTWNPPDWFMDACKNPVVLFMDEIDRATMEVRQGFFQLTDSRALNGFTLHPDTLIFAAVNGGENGSQYQVGEMDPAELDRWTVFDLEPSVEDWLNHAKGKVHGALWDFINKNHSHLEHKKVYEPNKIYPSRRSWFRLNDTLAMSGILDTNFKQDKGSLLTVYNISTAFVGVEAAVAIRDFLEKYDSQVTVDDVIKKGKITSTKDWAIGEHSAFAEKVKATMDAPYMDALNEKHKANFLRYLFTLPSEVFMVYITFLSSQHAQKMIELFQMEVDGQRLANYVRKYTVTVKKE